MGESGVLRLPNELQLQILSELLAKQIPRVRRTCRHFRDLIDDPSNLNAVARGIKQRNIARLQQSVDYSLDYAGVDLLDAWRRFSTLEDLWLRSDYWDAMDVFAETWSRQQNNFPSTDAKNSLRYIQAITMTLGIFHELQRDHHFPRLGRPSRSKREAMEIHDYELCSSEHFRICNFRPEVVENWYNRIMSGRCPELLIFDNNHFSFPRLALGLLSHLEDDLLTSYTFEYYPYSSRAMETECPVSMNEVATILGIPRLPVWGNDFLCPFAYCATNEQTYDKAMTAILMGEELPPLQMAGLLDDIYFC